MNWGNRAKKFDFEVNEFGCFISITHKSKRVKSNGYTTPMVRRGGKTIPLYRWIYKEMFGEIPNKMEVRHKCDNSECINPEHLQLGTHAENMKDMVERGRSGRRANEKLTFDNVREIRKLIEKGFKNSEIAKKYNIAQSRISAIRTNKAWKNVK